MKKTIGIVVVVIVLAVGAFLLLHKSSTTNKTQAASTSNTTQSKTTTTNSAVILTKSNSTLGRYLTDGSGNPLYTYASDITNVSNCTGQCLVEWPAYQDKTSATNLPEGVSTFKRTDNGQIQFAYRGMPLYYFVDDHNGQVTGDGKDNFHVAKPATSSSSTPAPQPSATTNTSSSSSSSSW